jgi:CheY-like chemotaxis protein
LKEIEAAHPALILLDLMMPVMSGYEVLQHLKANPQTEDIQVIIFTAATLSNAQRQTLPIPESMIMLKSNVSVDDIQQAIVEGLKQAV